MAEDRSTRESAGDYRTLFACELEQLSALSVGGDEVSDLSDMPVLRDDDGEFVIRGSSLAGALVATARTFSSVPDRISVIGDDSEPSAPSTWRFDHAKPVLVNRRAIEPELRPGSPHVQATRATADGMLHDIEVLPMQGQRWRFLLDVSLRDPRTGAVNATGMQDDLLAAIALREWKYSRCWLGRKVSRGLGWMRLASCKVLSLTKDHIDLWPDARLPSLDARIDFVSNFSCPDSPATVQDLENFIHTEPSLPHEAHRRRYTRWTCTARVGRYQPRGSEENFGLDTLALGGHNSATLELNEIISHVNCPAEANGGNSDVSLDMSLAMTRSMDSAGDRVYLPYVPGTAIGGALRAWLSARQRRSGLRVWDPVAQTNYDSDEEPVNTDRAAQAPQLDSVERLFGTRRGNGSRSLHVGSSLLIAEGQLTSESARNWLVAYLEHVALNPYTQGTNHGAKFNSLCLLDAQFSLQFVLEQDGSADSVEEREQISLIEAFLAAAGASRIGFGGGEFNGHGHLSINVEKREYAFAGEPWQEPVQPDLARHANGELT